MQSTADKKKQERNYASGQQPASQKPCVFQMSNYLRTKRNYVAHIYLVTYVLI